MLRWRGQRVPSSAVGSQLQRADRGSLAAEIRTLRGQDTSAQVYRATFGWFFAIFVVAEVVFFGLLVVLLRGRQQERRRRRWAIARVAGVVAGSVPAGSFLASLVPWWLLPHPAVLLYSLTGAWAIVIAAIALAGPWRRDPFGPPGAVAALTLAIIALDVMTGYRPGTRHPVRPVGAPRRPVLWRGQQYDRDLRRRGNTVQRLARRYGAVVSETTA